MKLQFIISFVLLKVVELLASRNISAKNPQFTMLNCVITVFFGCLSRISDNYLWMLDVCTGFKFANDLSDDIR